jgi:NAD(P)H-hydrate epimerase
LDIPTGFLGDTTLPFFYADKVVTLAAPKKLLYALDKKVEIYVADLGIPAEVYEKFNMSSIDFSRGNTLKLKR